MRSLRKYSVVQQNEKLSICDELFIELNVDAPIDIRIYKRGQLYLYVWPGIYIMHMMEGCVQFILTKPHVLFGVKGSVHFRVCNLHQMAKALYESLERQRAAYRCHIL